MTCKEVADSVGLPQKAILHLQKKEIISKAFDKRDIAILKVIAMIWCDNALIRLQLARLPKAKRLSVIKTCELNKVETYIYSRYQNNDGKLRVAAVASELQKYYNVPSSKDLYDTIRRIRKKVYNRRAYEDKARINGVPDVQFD